MVLSGGGTVVDGHARRTLRRVQHRDGRRHAWSWTPSASRAGRRRQRLHDDRRERGHAAGRRRVLAELARAGPCPEAVRGSDGHQHELARRLEPRDPLGGVVAELLERGRLVDRSPARRRPRRAAPTPGPAGRPPRPRRPSGCSRSAASTSCGHTVSAPVRIRSSSRPRTRSRPSSSIQPASPVRSQPSRVNAAAVAAGIAQVARHQRGAGELQLVLRARRAPRRRRTDAPS